MKLNLGCGKRILPLSEGWENVDKFPMPGADRVFDLFEFPWPLADACVEEILASHIIEHIPHQVSESKPVQLPLSEGGKIIWPSSAHLTQESQSELDGFFRFFQECWRILKLGGCIKCVAPYWTWAGAVWDPTHTRSICEATFSYLCPTEDNPNFDYHLPFRFSIIEMSYALLDEWQGRPEAEIREALRHNVNVATEITCVLRKEAL